MRTITQVANELVVSRKKIYNEIKNLKINTKKESKNNYVEDNDFLIIKCDIQEQTQNSSKCAEERLKNVLERDRNVMDHKINDREYTDLKERIFSLEEKIKIKDGQLQAKDHQINGLIQINLNTTKTLNSSSDDKSAC
jgi:hypothetical protein